MFYIKLDHMGGHVDNYSVVAEPGDIAFIPGVK